MAKNEEERYFLLHCIRTYRDLPALWDRKSKEYSNRLKKQESYEILLSNYKKRYPNATKEDVKKKINSLRTNFRKELRKILYYRRTTDTNGKTYYPTLWYFNEFTFLLNDKTPSESSSTIQDDELSNIVQCSTIFDESSSSIQLSPPPFKKQKTEKVPEHLSLIYEKQEEHYDYDDEYESLGRIWANELRKMDPIQQIFAKKSINDILYEGQLGTLNQHSVISRSSLTSITASPLPLLRRDSNYYNHSNTDKKPL